MANNNPGEQQRSHTEKSEDERSPSLPNRDEQSREDKEPHHGDAAHKSGTRSGNRGNFANENRGARTLVQWEGVAKWLNSDARATQQT